MSLPLSLYEFNKRKNSTKQPTGTAIAVPYVDLKESTSLNSPTFLLSGSVPFNANYCKYEGTYYWIDDITIDANNLWNIQCSIDPLATYANEIKSTRAYIEYSNVGNSRLTDDRLSRLMNAHETTNTGIISSRILDPNSGSVVIYTVGDDGSTGCFLASQGLASQLLNKVYAWWSDFENDHTWTDVIETLKNLGLLIIGGDAAANLKSARYVPFVPTSGELVKIHLGLYDTEIKLPSVDINARNIETCTITVPHAPNTYQRNSQFSEYTLYIPAIGNISISADILADETSVNIEFSVACCTGDMACRVYTGSGKTIGTYGASLGYDIPIGSSGIGLKSIVTSVAAVGAGAVSGGMGAAAAKSATAGSIAGKAAAGGIKAAFGAAVHGVQYTATTVGGLGSSAALGLDLVPKLTLSYWDASDSKSNIEPIIGYATSKVDTIGNYTFVKTGQASVSGIARGVILDMINDYLSGGVYIE